MCKKPCLDLIYLYWWEVCTYVYKRIIKILYGGYQWKSLFCSFTTILLYCVIFFFTSYLLFLTSLFIGFNYYEWKVTCWPRCINNGLLWRQFYCSAMSTLCRLETIVTVGCYCGVDHTIRRVVKKPDAIDRGPRFNSW